MHLSLDIERLASLEAAMEMYLDTLTDTRKYGEWTDDNEQERADLDVEIERASDLLADLGRIRAHAE